MAAALPVIASVQDAYGRLAALIGELPKAAVGPYLLSLLLSLPAALFPVNLMVLFAFVLISVVPYTLFAVAWHRIVVLGPAVAPPRLIPSWQPRHWRFLGYLLLLFGLALIPALLSGLILGLLVPEGLLRQLLTLAVMIAVGCLVLRLSLVLPAAALDEAYHLRHAWEHSRGQGLRLFSILFLTLLPLVLAALVEMALLGPLAGAGAASVFWLVVHHLASVVLNYIVAALGVIVLSQAFRTLAGWYPGDQHEPPG